MNPAGQTLHADHARVTFQIPVEARPLPLLFWHGWWVDSSCWDTTTDGREGFRTDKRFKAIAPRALSVRP